MTAVNNPPIRPDEDIPLGQFEGRWWVAHTKPRQEKALAWDFFRSDRLYFAPMYNATRRSKGRTWKTVLPLFPGYVFLCGSEDDRLFALQTNRIANIIEAPEQAKLLEELSAVQKLLDSGLAITSRSSLQKGTICRIRTGPLGGLEGRIEYHKSKARFVVNVSILGQAAMVEIDAELLEPLI